MGTPLTRVCLKWFLTFDLTMSSLRQGLCLSPWWSAHSWSHQSSLDTNWLNLVRWEGNEAQGEFDMKLDVLG